MDSLTCPTLPGADSLVSQYIVWIESITTISGAKFLIASLILARLVSQSR